MLILLHGLGLSRSIWDKLIPLIDCEVIAKDLPGHGNSNIKKYDWESIWHNAINNMSQTEINKATVVLHSFSAGVLPEIFNYKERPQKIYLLEGIIHPDDATWTKVIANMNVDEYKLWMPRWRSISNMTLKSQLVRSQLSSDVDKWSSGFKLVEEDALYIMSEQLQSRVHSTDLEFYLSSFERNIIYLQGSKSKIGDSGINFAKRCGCKIEEIQDAGHFPMLDNPEALAHLLN
jgi:pimeloyl-ACP methyl ester carboxylesterase